MTRCYLSLEDLRPEGCGGLVSSTALPLPFVSAKHSHSLYLSLSCPVPFIKDQKSVFALYLDLLAYM